jgi:hypothetical protein
LEQVTNLSAGGAAVNNDHSYQGTALAVKFHDMRLNSLSDTARFLSAPECEHF